MFNYYLLYEILLAANYDWWWLNAKLKLRVGLKTV